MIAERGLQGLSLRECARRAGVSHAAPYRHFADKEALLWAIAEQGFGWLVEHGEAAMEGVDDPRDRLDAYGAAYVRFAVTHPVHHRVMFSAELNDQAPGDEAAPRAGDPGEEEPLADTNAFQLLVESAAAVVGPEGDALIGAVASWSLTHGLAMLILDKRIPDEYVATPDDAEALARRVIAQWRGPLS